MPQERVERRLYLSLYQPKLAGEYLTVWVNVDPAKWADYQRGLPKVMQAGRRYEREHTPEAGKRFLEAKSEFDQVCMVLAAEVWTMPLEDVKQIHQANPQLFDWCMTQTWRMIREYCEERRGA